MQEIYSFSSYTDFLNVISAQKEMTISTKGVIKKICKMMSKFDEISRHGELKGYLIMIEEISSKFCDNLTNTVFDGIYEKISEHRETLLLSYQEKFLLLNNIDSLNKQLIKRDNYLQHKLDEINSKYQNLNGQTLKDGKNEEQYQKLQEIQLKTDSILEKLTALPAINSQREVEYDSNVHLTTIEKKVDYIYNFFNNGADSSLVIRGG